MLNKIDTTGSGSHVRTSATLEQRSQGDESRVVEYQVKLTDKQAPAEVLAELRGLLDSRGLKGRYLIEEGWRANGALVSIFVNSERVVEILNKQEELVHEASEMRQRVGTVCRRASQIKQFATNQHWAAVNDLLNIRLRFDSPQLKQVLAQINDMAGTGRDQRMAVVLQANAVRKEAINSIQRALAEQGLERKFTVPHSEWDGTNNSLTIVGTATVRARLVLQANVTVEGPLRTARGW